MELTVRRHWYTPRSTIGQLVVNGKEQCYILEDPVRRDDPLTAHIDEGTKIPGKTAIPAGRYRVVVSWSPRFKRLLPELLDVPGFTGIRIHPGNTPEDTEGCLLPGRHPGTDVVTESRAAFDALFPLIAGVSDECWIEIIDDPWVRAT